MQAHPLLMKLCSFLFGTFLSLALVSYTLAGFTEYSVIQPTFTGIISQQFEKQGGQIDSGQVNQALALQCENQATVELPLQNGNLQLDCAEIKKGTSFNAVVAKAMFDKEYYKSRDCAFIGCVRQEVSKGLSPEIAFLFISQQAHNFYKSAILVILVLAVVFGLLMLELEQTWIERFKSLGWTFFFNGAPYLFTFFTKDKIVSLFAPVLNKLAHIYLVLLVAGVALLAAGYWMQYKNRQTTAQPL